MRAYFTPLFLLLTSGGLAGCSSSDTGGSTATTDNFLGSCDTRTVAGGSVGQCRDWVGTPGADLSVSCSGLNGTFNKSGRCPAAGRVGQCSLAPVLGATAQYNYYGTEYTEASAEANCDGLSGTFSTGAGGAGGTGGASGTGGGGQCPPECLRPYECVTACGEEPQNYGCCPCPEGKIDNITCTRGT
jgi:hypothetical protein